MQISKTHLARDLSFFSPVPVYSGMPEICWSIVVEEGNVISAQVFCQVHLAIIAAFLMSRLNGIFGSTGRQNIPSGRFPLFVFFFLNYRANSSLDICARLAYYTNYGRANKFPKIEGNRKSSDGRYWSISYLSRLDAKLFCRQCGVSYVKRVSEFRAQIWELIGIFCSWRIPHYKRDKADIAAGFLGIEVKKSLWQKLPQKFSE